MTKMQTALLNNPSIYLLESYPMLAGSMPVITADSVTSLNPTPVQQQIREKTCMTEVGTISPNQSEDLPILSMYPRFYGVRVSKQQEALIASLTVLVSSQDLTIRQGRRFPASQLS